MCGLFFNPFLLLILINSVSNMSHEFGHVIITFDLTDIIPNNHPQIQVLERVC